MNPEYFKKYNHIVPYRDSVMAPLDPYFELFLIFADHFGEFFKSRNGLRFDYNGIDHNRQIVRDWDEIIRSIGCVESAGQCGYIGVSHPLRDEISDNMRSWCSGFNIIWVPYDLALKIMTLGYLP